jgi:hypothetical protein
MKAKIISVDNSKGQYSQYLCESGVKKVFQVVKESGQILFCGNYNQCREFLGI